MLVLSRDVNEVVVIGDSIRIVVISVRGSQVRLGIDAPTEIPVHREEVYDKIQRQQQRKGESES